MTRRERVIGFTISGLLWLASAQGQTTFTISTVAGDGNAGYLGDGGAATRAGINPNGVAVDAAGNVYIADFRNERIRKVVPSGIITTVAGNGNAGYRGDGGPAINASLNRPSRVSVDNAGNLYIADSGNSRIRKVTPDGIITTVAGNGNPGYSGDGGLATRAALNYPEDAVADSAGNLFIADGDADVVRKVGVDGSITTVAGNGAAGYSGDGGAATQASLSNPVGLAVDGAGNLYISDQGNQRIRKVTNGIISTIAGDGKAGYAGDGAAATAAELNSPVCLHFDSAGNLYIGDRDNNRIRVVLANGTIWTVAGDGSAAYSGDGGSALDAGLSSPKEAAVAPDGSIYVADDGNSRIRILTPVLHAPAISPSGGVANGASFQAGIAPGSWITITGTNLSSVRDTWANSIVNGNLPTSLDGVKVTVGGDPAYVAYVSPTQINALAPNVAAGTVSVTVTNANGTSASVNAVVQAAQPAFFLWPGNYAVATTQDYGLAVKNGTFPGSTTTPAKPGEVIILWGTGFGATSPSAPSDVEVPSSTTYNTANAVTVTVGGTAATVYGAALAPGFAGLYQVAILIPASLANGDYPVVATISGVQSPSTTLITVQD
jgi:uncharacterized protein (TIGR03437 family)